MRQHGYKEGFNAKDTVPYIICYEQVHKTEVQLNTNQITSLLNF